MTRPRKGEDEDHRSHSTTRATNDPHNALPPTTALTRSSLSGDEKLLLLRIARKTLEIYFQSGKAPRFTYDVPSLNQPRAVFVTLWRSDTGELRGCRGESVARRPLQEAVSTMAIASAVDDPRFFPVTLEELPKLRIEINALTPLAPMQPEEIEVGRHGLMVVRGSRAGLLLPDVPVRFEWDSVQFLEGTCQKAGLPRDAWQDPDVQIYGFASEEWSEQT